MATSDGREEADHVYVIIDCGCGWKRQATIKREHLGKKTHCQKCGGLVPISQLPKPDDTRQNAQTNPAATRENSAAAVMTRCPQCGRGYRLPHTAVGQHAKCKCGLTFVVAASGTPAPEIKKDALAAAEPVAPTGSQEREELRERRACPTCRKPMRLVLRRGQPVRTVCVFCSPPAGKCVLCGESLRTAQAEQCMHCFADWHGPRLQEKVSNSSAANVSAPENRSSKPTFELTPIHEPSVGDAIPNPFRVLVSLFLTLILVVVIRSSTRVVLQDPNQRRAHTTRPNSPPPINLQIGNESDVSSRNTSVEAGKAAATNGARQEGRDWTVFTDAGGRFTCEIPKEARTVQVESGARSKVAFNFTGGQIGVIVRTTNWHVIRQEELDELSANARRISDHIFFFHQRLGSVDGSTSADIAGRMTGLGQTLEMRQVKYKKHGYDHTITLSVEPGNFDRLNPILERFLESYRSIGTDR